MLELVALTCISSGRVKQFNRGFSLEDLCVLNQLESTASYPGRTRPFCNGGDVMPTNRLLRRVLPAVFVLAGLSSSAFAQSGGNFTCDASNGGEQEFEVPVSPHTHKIS